MLCLSFGLITWFVKFALWLHKQHRRVELWEVNGIMDTQATSVVGAMAAQSSLGIRSLEDTKKVFSVSHSRGIQQPGELEGVLVVHGDGRDGLTTHQEDPTPVLPTVGQSSCRGGESAPPTEEGCEHIRTEFHRTIEWFT